MLSSLQLFINIRNWLVIFKLIWVLFFRLFFRKVIMRYFYYNEIIIIYYFEQIEDIVIEINLIVENLVLFVLNKLFISKK